MHATERCPPHPFGTPQNPWRRADGSVIACTEKIKVMQENMQELFQMAQDAFEDGLLMGCAEAQLRAYLQALAAGVENPYRP